MGRGGGRRDPRKLAHQVSLQTFKGKQPFEKRFHAWNLQKQEENIFLKNKKQKHLSCVTSPRRSPWTPAGDLPFSDWGARTRNLDNKFPRTFKPRQVWLGMSEARGAQTLKGTCSFRPSKKLWAKVFRNLQTKKKTLFYRTASRAPALLFHRRRRRVARKRRRARRSLEALTVKDRRGATQLARLVRVAAKVVAILIRKPVAKDRDPKRVRFAKPRRRRRARGGPRLRPTALFALGARPIVAAPRTRARPAGRVAPGRRSIRARSTARPRARGVPRHTWWCGCCCCRSRAARRGRTLHSRRWRRRWGAAGMRTVRKGRANVVVVVQ